MKRVYVFVEGRTDQEFLRRILPPELLQDAVFVTADESSGMLSLARSVVARRRKPIAYVMDADSNEPDVIEERRESTEELIRVAGGSVPVKVLAVVPGIEAWLFAAPEAIGRALGAPVPSELIRLGKRDPKGVLQLLAEKNKKEWDSCAAICLLDAVDIERIRAIPEVTELTEFLTKVQNDDQAA